MKFDLQHQSPQRTLVALFATALATLCVILILTQISHSHSDESRNDYFFQADPLPPKQRYNASDSLVSHSLTPLLATPKRAFYSASAYDSEMREHLMSSENPISTYTLQLRLGQLNFQTSITNRLALFHFQLGWKALSAFMYDLATQEFITSLESEEGETNIMARVGQLLCLRRFWGEALIEQAQPLVAKLERYGANLRFKPIEQLSRVQLVEVGLMNATIKLFSPHVISNGTIQSQLPNDKAFTSAMKSLTELVRADPNVDCLYALGLLMVNNYNTTMTLTHEFLLARTIVETVLYSHPRHPTALHLALITNDVKSHPSNPAQLFKLAKTYVEECPDSVNGVQMSTHILCHLGQFSEVVDVIEGYSINATLTYCDARYVYHGGVDNQTVSIPECSFSHKYHQIERLHYALIQLGKYKAANGQLRNLENLVARVPSYFYRDKKITAKPSSSRHEYDNQVAQKQRMMARQIIERFIWLNLNFTSYSWKQFISEIRNGQLLIPLQTDEIIQKVDNWLMYSQAAAISTNALMKLTLWFDEQLNSNDAIDLHSFDFQLAESSQKLIDQIKLHNDGNDEFGKTQFVCRSLEMLPHQLSAMHSLYQSLLQLKIITAKGPLTSEPESGSRPNPSTAQLLEFHALSQKALTAAVNSAMIAEQQPDKQTADSPAIDILDSHQLLATVLQWVFNAVGNAPTTVRSYLRNISYRLNFSFPLIDIRLLHSLNTRTHDDTINHHSHRKFVHSSVISAFPSLSLSLCLKANYLTPYRSAIILCQSRSYGQMSKVAIEQFANTEKSIIESTKFKGSSTKKYQLLKDLWREAEEDEIINPALAEVDEHTG